MFSCPSRRARDLRRVAAMGAALLGLGLCLPACETLPPAVQTPYAVGSQTRFIHDSTRGFDPLAGVTTGERVLITEIWYPVDPTSVDWHSAAATWGDYVFADPVIQHRMMSNTTFYHLTPASARPGVSQAQMDAAIDALMQQPRDSYRNLPLLPGRSHLPVVVMSHGDAGSRYNMETVCETLATHGYLVIAADHTGNSPWAMVGKDPALTTDPEFRERMKPVSPLLDEHGAYSGDSALGQSYAPFPPGHAMAENLVRLDQALRDRILDLGSVLDELQRMNRAGVFAGRIDLQRIGVMGRSLGGATTLAALQHEPRFRSGMAVVPFGIPNLGKLLPPEKLATAAPGSVFLGNAGNSLLAPHRQPLLVLAAAQDEMIIPLEQSLSALLGTPAPSEADPQPILHRVFTTATGPVAFGMLARINHSSLAVAGPWWWPQLKPDHFPQVLDASRDYQLLDSQLAHRIQAELALHFFDATLRGDHDAARWLESDPFAAIGLRLEARGFLP